MKAALQLLQPQAQRHAHNNTQSDNNTQQQTHDNANQARGRVDQLRRLGHNVDKVGEGGAGWCVVCCFVGCCGFRV